VLTAALATTGAHAGVLDIGSVMGGANVFTAGNFTANSSDVEGAIVSGGNVSIASYAVNQNGKAAYGGYAVAAGGNLVLQNGAISNGKTYAGGTTTLSNAAQTPGTTISPVDFAVAAQQFKDIATGLSLVASTGTVTRQYSANKVTGSGKGGVDVFNVNADFFNGGDNWMLSGLSAGQALIFNISGKQGGFNGGNIGFEPLSGYNVLFNFYEAESINVRGIIGSVLAPYATVENGWGVINGQVVADTWNSSVQVNSNHYFKPVDVAGFELVKNTPPAEVPEPGTLALMLAGAAGIAGVVVSRRRRLRPA
jgi:choice-of-anchor A domain-containing protein